MVDVDMVFPDSNGVYLSSLSPRWWGSGASSGLESLDSCFRRKDGNWSVRPKYAPLRSESLLHCKDTRGWPQAPRSTQGWRDPCLSRGKSESTFPATRRIVQ